MSESWNPHTALSLTNPNHVLQLRLRKVDGANRRTEDNFCTPKNDFFYKNSPYLPLDPSGQELRLLKIHSRKPYAQHVLANPEWAPINQADGKPLQINVQNLGNLIASNPELGISDPNMPVLAVEILDKAPLPRVDGDYWALSYCAGKPTNTALMLVDGLPFNAFANLEHAIDQALQYWNSKHPNKECFLWADQICINQRDDTERTNQVNMMRRIYQRSGETLICLSTPQSLDCLSWASSLFVDEKTSKRSKIKILEERILQHLVPDQPENFNSPYPLPRNPQESQWLSSLKNFLENPWWRRSWIYQEFISSKKPCFLANSTFTPWSDMHDLLEWICFEMNTILDDAINGTNVHVEDNFTRGENDAIQALQTNARDRYHSNQQQYQEQLQRYKLDHQQWKRQEESRQSSYNQVQRDMQSNQKKRDAQHWQYSIIFGDRPSSVRLSNERVALEKRMMELCYPIPEPQRPFEPISQDLTHEIEQVKEKWKAKRGVAANWQREIRKFNISAVQSMVSGKINFKRSSDLKILLQHSRNCESSDPRDRVYAFLGLAHRGYGIVPDYSFSHTIIHVLVQTAQQIINYDKSLDILQHVRRGRDKLGTFLPTWVPDWTSKELVPGLESYISFLKAEGYDTDFDASSGRLPEPKYRIDEKSETNTDIQLKGIFLGYLGEFKSPVEGFPQLSRFSPYDGNVAICENSSIADNDADDEIWILYGSSRPVLLREYGADSYAFRGEVLLFDNVGTPSLAMFGKLFLDKTKIIERELWLV